MGAVSCVRVVDGVNAWGVLSGHERSRKCLIHAQRSHLGGIWPSFESRPLCYWHMPLTCCNVVPSEWPRKQINQRSTVTSGRDGSRGVTSGHESAPHLREQAGAWPNREDRFDMDSLCACTCGRPGCVSYTGPRIKTHGTLVHGTSAATRNGCRCDVCTDAKRARVSKEMHERNESTMLTATKRGQEWTGPELEMVMRTDLTGREIAKMLGRTYAGVMRMRHLCRTDPKYAALLGAGREATA